VTFGSVAFVGSASECVGAPYTDLAKRAVAVERDVAAKRAADSPTPSPHTTIATAAPEVAASPA
jgi:hypothetical protein